MKVELIFITYNRLDYTRLALSSVLADPTEEFSLVIWDNASTDGTPEYLENEVKDPRITRKVLSKKNVGQIAAVNQVWSESKADLLGKLDNDCILTQGWTRTLGRAHQDIPELGVVACWHFMSEDFDYEKAKHKIQDFGQHRILRHPWTCGTGLLVKTATYRRFGAILGDGTTQYWVQMAKAGYVNGFYYPLILQEHMDDLRSPHNRARAASFSDAYQHTVGWKNGAFGDRETYDRLHRRILDNLLTGSYNPGDYDRPRWKRIVDRIVRVAADSRKPSSPVVN